MKPDFFKDEDLAELSFQTRLFYAGLWNFADKKGRLEDRPKRLKADIFPYDTADIDKFLDSLSQVKKSSERPFIQRYEVDGQKYIQIINWDKHQKPHHTEKDSTIPPAPPLNTVKIKGMEKQDEASKELSNGEVTVKTPLKTLSFEDLWFKYPNKDGRKAAERAFRSSVKNEADFSSINKALDNYINSKKVKEGYIKNGSTWFNNWQDWENYQEPKTEKDVDHERRKSLFRDAK